MSEPIVFLVRDPVSLHVQSVKNRWCEYKLKYKVIAIQTISAITSKHMV